MLRTNNRNVSSNRQPKKPDNLELCSLVDRCTCKTTNIIPEILRDDRIQLRALVKEQHNQKLIDILSKHKKKNNLDGILLWWMLDLSDLQIELRKFLNEQKGRKINTSPDRDFVKKKNVQKENVCEPPY